MASKLSLSGLEHAAFCPGFPKLAENLSQGPSTEPQLRGTALHLAAQLMLKANSPELSDADLTLVRFIFDVTWEDLQDASAAYFEVMAKKPKPPEGMEVMLLVEHELKVDVLGLVSYVRADGQRSNRLDVAWVVAGHIALIFELKFGTSEVTHPKRNLQVHGQAVALAREFNLWAVDIYIFQPRAWHGEALRSFLLDEEALELTQADIAMKVKRTTLPDAPLRQGNFCTWCDAKAVCPARMARPLIPSPTEMTLETFIAKLTPEARVQQYEQLSAFQDWAKDCRSKFEQLAEQYPLTGYGKVKGKPKREWVDGPETLKALKKATKLAGLKADDLLRPETIGNVEKALKGKPEALAVLHDSVQPTTPEEKFTKLEGA